MKGELSEPVDSTLSSLLKTLPNLTDTNRFRQHLVISTKVLPIHNANADGLEYFWKYVDNTRSRVPKNRMYLSWQDSTTHTPLILPPNWTETNSRSYLEKEGDSSLWTSREHLPLDSWLNALRWTDDIVKEIILGFRERGLEDETLFLMYVPGVLAF